jgi:PleD family two-component response regulator
MSKKRLLIVEDDFDVAEMLIMYFQSQEYEVIHAEEGLKGIELARTRFPNLILLDVMLPTMDGYDVCTRLRKNALTKYIPVIFLTQRDERSAKVRGLELGADDYITKPFDVDELRLRVARSIKVATTENLHELRTGLPTGPLIEEELERCRHSGKPFTEFRYTLAHTEGFTDTYGFVAFKEVLTHVGRTMQESTTSAGTLDDFIGIDKDDVFVLLTQAPDPHALSAKIKQAFDSSVNMFYSFFDLERGGLLLNEGTANEKIVPLITLEKATTPPNTDSKG